MHSLIDVVIKALTQKSTKATALKSTRLGFDCLEGRDMPSGMANPLIALSPASLSLIAVETSGNQSLAAAAKASTLPDYDALDKDDTIYEVDKQLVDTPKARTNNLGPITAFTNYSRTEKDVAIQITKVTGPGTNYVNFKNPVGWGDFKSANGKDVDLYRFEVNAGDRIMFQVETTSVEHTFIDPVTKKPGKPDNRRLPVRLELFDKDGMELSQDIGGDPRIVLPSIFASTKETTVWQMPFTFSANGVYYLGISAALNSTYDPKTGKNDADVSATFGTYKLNIRYLEQHLPDLVAREISRVNNGVLLTYDVSQKEIPGVGRPDEWRLGGKLYWVAEDGTRLGEAAANQMADFAANKVGYTNQVGRTLFVSTQALGAVPLGATHLAFVMNADGKTPEPSRLNNIKLLSLAGATTADLRATHTDAEDGKTVNYRYEVVNQPMTGDYQVAIYRGSQPDFSSDMELVQAVPMPALDEEGDNSTELGTHSITVTYANEIRGTASRPYLFVVAIPVGAETFGQGSIVETDLANNAAPLGRITASQLLDISNSITMGKASNFAVNPLTAESYANALSKAFGEFGIISPQRQAAFLGQSMHETFGFNALSETDAYSDSAILKLYGPNGKYANKKMIPWTMGPNNKPVIPPHSQWYIGRGFLHLSLKSNYQAASIYLFGDTRLDITPALVEDDPLVAARTAGWFWDKFRKLNPIADTLPEAQGTAFDNVVNTISGLVNKPDALQATQRINFTFAAWSAIRPPSADTVAFTKARDAAKESTSTGPTNRGVSAILFGSWNGQSVKNFHDVVLDAPVSSFELEFNPSLTQSSPYANVRKFLLGGELDTAAGTRKIKGLLTTDKKLTITVQLGFHGQGTSLDKGAMTAADSIQSRVKQFVDFATRTDAQKIPLYQRVHFVLSPSLEDNYSEAQFEAIVKTVASYLPMTVLDAITFRRIPSPDAVRKDGVVVPGYTPAKLTGKEGTTDLTVNPFQYEYHGLPADAGHNDYGIISNDGYFVWADINGDKNRRQDESAITAAHTDNPDDLRKNDKQKFSDYQDALLGTNHDTALFWRPAYNLFDYARGQAGDAQDVNGWTKPASINRSDLNNDPHFNKREKELLRQFLITGMKKRDNPLPPNETAPIAPSYLRQSNLQPRSMDLNWDDASDNETEFQIKISRDVGATWEQVGTTGANATSFHLDTLSPNTRYLFEVRAANATGASGYSNIIDVTTPHETPVTPTTPMAPGNLRAANVWARKIDLNWDDRSNNETSFQIAISSDGGATWRNLGITGANDTSLRVENLQPGTRYLFKMRAANGEVYSDYSNVLDVTTLPEAPAAPAAPGNFRTANVYPRKIDFNWDDLSNNETEFRIAMSSDGGATWGNVGVTGANDTGLRVENLQPGTRYLFKMLAANAGVYSDYSNVIDVTTTPEAPAAPATPGNFRTANVYPRKIDFNWDDLSNNETEFRVAMSSDGGATWGNVGVTNANDTSLRVENLLPSTRYLFKMRAANGGVYSDYTNVLDVTTPAEAPVAPATPGNFRLANLWARTIDLNWDDLSNNETSFRIAMSSDGGASWKNIGVTGANAVSWRVENLLPNTRYLLKMRAANGEVYSDYSNVLDITTLQETPVTPGNFRLANLWARTIDLNWDDLSNNETAFRVAMSSDGGATWNNVGVTGANVTSLRVENLLPNTRYLFKMRAANGEVYSDYSNVLDITTRQEPPAAPGNLRTSNIWARTIDLKWDDRSNNETEFRIAISRDGGATWDNIGVVGVNVTSFRVSNLNPNTRYLFKVRAGNSVGYSDYSNIIDVRTLSS